MSRALQRLLTQVARHHRERYEALPEDLRARYESKGGSAPFGWPRDKATAEQRRRVRQQVAEDMYCVLAFYDGEEAITNKDTYKQLHRVFEEHCEVVEDAVTVRSKSGSRALQSLSDPDATYDGHKGRGYQAQLSETCSEHNAVQLITDVLPQTAADSDSEALPEMVERLEDKQRKPDVLLADAAYGSDANVEHCASQGVELVAPAKRRQEDNRDALTALDCELDAPSLKVTRCPAGHRPCATHYNANNDEGYALFPRATCEGCPLLERCLAHKFRNQYRLKYSKKTLRLDTRRREQERPAFQARYRKRAGVEGLMSALKRGRGFGRLRVRGQRAVGMNLYLKAAGYHLMQAAKWVRKQPNALQTGQHEASRRPALRSGLKPVLRRISSAINSPRLPPQHRQPFKPYLTARLCYTLLAG